ncbi:MAG: hypothetical protein KC983_05240 [Phycisphaerales bacterium]|nr:hypothetical protein [Phycisphaerales bacterium]
MKIRFVSILLLIAIAFQVPFGMLNGRFVVCFGGCHEHAPHEVISECQHACSHDSDWPMPVPVDHHDSDHDDDNCGCTDLELAMASLLATIRHDSDIALPPMPPFAVLPIVDAPPDAHVWHGPPRQCSADPAGRQRLACMRTIRLNV